MLIDKINLNLKLIMGLLFLLLNYWIVFCEWFDYVLSYWLSDIMWYYIGFFCIFIGIVDFVLF